MKKDIIISLILVIAISIFVMNTDFKSVDDYYTEHAADITDGCETVFISVNCKSVLSNMDKLDKNLVSFIPDDGIIIPKTEYVLREGDTVFDILKRATAINKVQMEYSGGKNSAYKSVYIEGIGYLYEFSCGAYSGWSYKVNGEEPKKGCSSYKLSDKDVIEWIYTVDFEEVYE